MPHFTCSGRHLIILFHQNRHAISLNTSKLFSQLNRLVWQMESPNGLLTKMNKFSNESFRIKLSGSLADVNQRSITRVNMIVWFRSFLVAEYPKYMRVWSLKNIKISIQEN